ncbi:hypothetical protein QTP86_011909 [Hemibagrus guttatus]|nr:hypothetical protein QTP86_011909 [Hemibagrus guttatus]
MNWGKKEWREKYVPKSRSSYSEIRENDSPSRQGQCDRTELLQDVEPLDFYGDDTQEVENRRYGYLSTSESRTRIFDDLRMEKGFKAEGEQSGLDTDTAPRKTENHGHTFRFHYQSKTYKMTCNAPMTILERLQTDSSFKAICEINQSKELKEMVIRREPMPRGAVRPHFPCCLLNHDELLDIKFIKSGGNSDTMKAPKLAVHSAENLVCFYIKTRGEENIRKVVKNNKLKNVEVDYVCVYAVKGEKVKVALKRDGRFTGADLKEKELSVSRMTRAP